jgi:pimeloyl-ACP methyl ester carboxylesterase
LLLPERRWSRSPSLVESAPGPSRRRIPSCPDSRTRGAASLFAFAANSDPSGVADIAQSPVFNAYIARAEKEYAALSPTPSDYKAFLEQIEKMRATQPNWTAEQLHAIAVPVWIVDADHDEAIKRENTEFMATSIPGAGLLIQPEVSHFSFLQDPRQFTGDVLHFLEHAEAR